MDKKRGVPFFFWICYSTCVLLQLCLVLPKLIPVDFEANCHPASRSLFWFICISKPTKQGLTLCSREWNRVVTANSCLFTQPSLKGFPFFISLFCLLGSPYYELLSKILKCKAFSFISTIFPWSNFISPSHWEFAFAGYSFPETSPGSNAFATKIYPSKEVILHPERIPG